MTGFARSLISSFLFVLATIMLFWPLIFFIAKMFKKEAAKKKEEEAQKDAWENPQLQTPPVAPTKKPKKPVDPDDIQISGPIPLADDADVSQSKTQPIPVVSEAPVLSGGGSPPTETKILHVQDHILESFYRKISDPKSYDWQSFPDDFRSQFGADAMPIFEAYVAYDTEKISPGLSEARYFVDPVWVREKTYLETNLEIGGGILVASNGNFVFKTTVIRFLGDAKKEDIKQVLEGGFYEYMDMWTHTRGVISPFSSFIPLNPFDPEPKVFFFAHKDILVRCHGGVHVSVRFPRGLGQVGSFSLKIEFPGIIVRPNYKQPKYG